MNCGPYWVWAPALSLNALAYFILTFDSSSYFPTSHLFMSTCPCNTQTIKINCKTNGRPSRRSCFLSLPTYVDLPMQAHDDPNFIKTMDPEFDIF